eukprot:TRINITY_DN2550_c0_g2_i3.p1 TRINITY_DN2550_c0_g2~~TRINITY_DN2550_c0_g2_i3.p1  ORF type:complete len:439 (-),score=53.55 TRINITY_DN2550_c0_g2_i3:74-1390(-)
MAACGGALMASTAILDYSAGTPSSSHNLINSQPRTGKQLLSGITLIPQTKAFPFSKAYKLRLLSSHAPLARRRIFLSNFEGLNKGFGKAGIRERCQGHVRASATAEQSGRQGSSDLIVCFGEMLIDFVPTVGGLSLANAPAFKKAPGGAPANVAVGIARLGGHSAFVGKVGDDEFGHMLVDILKENQVDSRGIRFDEGARTALAFVTLRHDGEREFMFYRNPSADMLLKASELDVDLIKQASVFHYGSISLITEPCRSAHLAAMKIAKEAGVLLSYDPNLRLPLWPSAEAAREGIKSIWNDADIIKVSEEEVAFLTEGGDPYSHEVARSLFHDNLKLLLITEGQAGCRYYTKECQGRVPGHLVQAVDTTGAGDAFVGGFLTQLVGDLNLYKNEERLIEALCFANACGAITTTERGAIPALPDKDTVLKLMSKILAEAS